MATFRPQDISKLNSEQLCFLFFFVLEYTTPGYAIGIGINLLTQISASCRGFLFLGVTLISIGVAFIILCYVACAMARNIDAALAKSACCSVPLLVLFAGLGIFALAVSSKGGGKSIPGRSYEEFHVEDYSNWMVKKVNDTHNWDKYYKKAVVKNHVCNNFFKDYRLDTIDEFHHRSLNHFESGCCKPSEECNFNYTSPTVWVKQNNGNYSNTDCKIWDNDPKILCFNCQSCKAAFLQDLKSQWFDAGVIIVLLASLQVIISICFVYRMSRASKRNHA